MLVRNKYVESYLAAFMQNQITYIVSEYSPDLTTLRSVLQNKASSEKNLIEGLYKLAKILNQLVNQKVSVSHGHLHPDNILVL